MIKITRHDAGSEFSAPEGYYFKEAHLIGGDRFAVFWEGRPTPPSLVKLCNQLVRSTYATESGEAPMQQILKAIERELDAQGLRELA